VVYYIIHCKYIFEFWLKFMSKKSNVKHLRTDGVVIYMYMSAL
jgi:hypothetical protein